MFISSGLKKISTFVVLSISITACGGGSGSGSDFDDELPKAINGKAQKGAFLKDSAVTAFRLDAKAVRTNDTVDTKITDDIGSFSITPTWNDWTEMTVTGRFFDEDSAETSVTELTLNSFVPAGQKDSNINLFTHFVAERARQILLLDENTTIEIAHGIAQSDLKKELSLLSQEIDQMDMSQGDSSLKSDNAILLLFSGGFMSNNGNSTSLLMLTDDFAKDGRIDDSGLTFFQGVANYVGIKSNLEHLSNNLKQAGFDSPPTVDDLTNLPSWANQPPLVTITPKGKTISEGQSITMEASASIDPEGEALTFSWSGSGTESCGEKEFCVVEGLTIGSHNITLTARDVGQSVASEIATVIVVPADDINKVPSAIVEPATITVNRDIPTTFDASKSFDEDSDLLSYEWSGPGTENCNDSATCTVNGLSEGVYFISVRVSDNKGGVNSASSRMTIISSSKVINGQAQKGPFLKDSVVTAYRLDSKAVRGNGIVNTQTTNELGSYSVKPSWDGWTEVSVTGRFFDEDSSANSATELTLNNIVPAVQIDSNINLFTHFVTERTRQILSANDNITIDDAHQQARVNLKTELSLLSQNVHKMDILNGTGSLKSDNAILLLFSGGFMSNNGNATSLLTLTDDFANNGKIDDTGVTFFQGVANYVGIKSNLEHLSNNLKQAGFDSPPSVDDLINLPSWANQPPLVTLTPKGKTIFQGQSIVMDATASIDPEGGALNYSWSGSGTDACEEKELCEINGLSVGTHLITLTARDEGLNIASETASVIVIPVEDTNIIPTVALQPAVLSVKKDVAAVFDASSSTDADGDTLSYDWAGPGTENCDNRVTCSVNGLSEGVYFITVTVSDNKGGLDSAFSRLTVVAPNVPPVANAGVDITTTKDRSIELSGTAIDSDGTIDGYEWKQGDLSLGTSEKITISGLGVGEYEYTLIVTDNNGATASDTVRVTVADISNSTPVANAGNDKVITHGQSVFLFGSATDLDGTIESYKWFEGVTLLGEAASIVVPGLSVGTHNITLIVTDDKGGDDSDIVKVTVNPLIVTVDVDSSACIVRLGGRYFLVEVILQGGITGSGTTIGQEYESTGCTGDKVGGEFSLPTTYSITNIQTSPTDNSITTADMNVSNLAGTEITQVFIVDGNVVIP